MLSDERNLDVVEHLIPVAESAGLSLTHMALAFVLAHPGIVSAVIGPRTMEQLDDLLAGVDVKLDDPTLDQIDEIAAPGADIASLEGAAYVPPAIRQVQLRRRPANERTAA